MFGRTFRNPDVTLTTKDVSYFVVMVSRLNPEDYSGQPRTAILKAKMLVAKGGVAKVNFVRSDD